MDLIPSCCVRVLICHHWFHTGLGAYGQLGMSDTVDRGLNEVPSSYGTIDMGADVISIAAGEIMLETILSM